MFNRSIPILAVVLLALCISPVSRAAAATDTWTRVSSKNFLLIGNASEKEIGSVALKLEQFRYVFSRVFPEYRLNSPVPTNVVVFKSASAFRPFAPLYQGKPGNVSGYFESGDDVNYIAITIATEQLTDDPLRTIFHEYVHLMVHNTLGNVPLWLNEGLAEYYSTFRVDEDQGKVWLGKVIPAHVLLLRGQRMLPLRTLFSVDTESPYYNERDKQSIFYAESWALVHYLILGNEQRRQRGVGQFVELLRSGMASEKAFRQAFGADYETIDRELQAYIQRNTYSQGTASFRQKLEFDAAIQSRPAAEAEARAYLGDLLLHTQRFNEAEAMLHQALALDSKLAMAHASLGMLRVGQKRFDEAIEHLRKAVAADKSNYLAHYYYAFALSRIGMDERQKVEGYPPEATETMRAELRKAMELCPDFPEPYHVLAFINLVRDEQLDESISMLKHALTLSPGRDDFAFVLAQLHMRKQDFTTARQVLQPMLRENAAARSREHAQLLLNAMKSIEEQMTRLKPEGSSKATSADPSVNLDSPEAQVSLEPGLRKPQAGELRVRGVLSRVDCLPVGIVFAINAGGRTLRLHSKRLEQVEFITYTTDVKGEITCGARKPPSDVVVTYHPTQVARVKFDGEMVALEFVPKDFELKTKP